MPEDTQNFTPNQSTLAPQPTVISEQNTDTQQPIQPSSLIINSPTVVNLTKKQRLNQWIKSHKIIVIPIGVILIAAIATGVYFFGMNTPKQSIVARVNNTAENIQSTQQSQQNNPSTPSTVASTVNLPEVYNASSGYSLLTETYLPPSKLVTYAGSKSPIVIASSTLVKSRILVYSRPTGIYTGITDAQIDLYDTSSGKDYVLVPGGNSSSAIFNSSPILLANNKMLFVKTTGSPANHNEATTLELMNLETGTISRVSVPFSDITTLNAVAVAPNGDNVAYPMKNAILTLDTSTNTTKTYPVSMTGNTFSGDTSYTKMVWSADSTTIYFGNQYFIVPSDSSAPASFQKNQIYGLNTANGKTTLLTTDNAGNDILQVYGTRLFFKQYSSTTNSVEAYLDLSKSPEAVTVMPGSNNFVWPILPTADLNNYIVVPNNYTAVNLMDFAGNLVQDIYANIVASGKLATQYYSSSVIGWIDSQTLLLAEQTKNNSQDLYTYNIKTKAVTPVLKSAH